MREKHLFFQGLPVTAVSAHRGASLLFPENTKAALQSAVEAGADILETDVQMTRDLCPVLCHDSIVDRITDGVGSIRNYSLAQLKRLDAGYRMGNAEKGYPHRGAHRIQTLREGFENFPDTRFTIDIKRNSQALVMEVFSLIGEFGRAARTLVTSFDGRTLDLIEREIKETGLEVATAASARDIKRCFLTSVAGRMFPPASTMSLFLPPIMEQGLYDDPIAAKAGWKERLTRAMVSRISLITPDFVKMAHGHGLPVFAWTIDDAEQAMALVNMGVDGLVTNDPHRICRLVHP